MEALLDNLVNALRADPTLAGIAGTWLVLILWGTLLTVLAYLARTAERSAMADPPQHPWFPRHRDHKR